MDTVRYIKLKNDGGFVARIQIQYKRRRVDDDGNVSFDAEWHSWSTDGYRDICSGGERTVDLTEIHIPDGSYVRLKAEVVMGKSRTGDICVFQSGCGTMLSYRISGTTLINKLTTV